MSMGSVLEQRRKELGLLQADVAIAMEQEGFKITKYMLSRWENDKSEPNAHQFLHLCRVLKIHDVMAEFMGEGNAMQAGLNREGKARLEEYARMLHKCEEFRIEEERPDNIRMLPLYDLAVSAGTGQFLDGENYEMVECGAEVPEGSNFGVRIAGDSMEPQYHDGQTIWVRQQRNLMSGEIGIFLYDGNAFLKKLVLEDGKTKLHSLNPQYPDIIISTALPLRVLGKVLN